ncbi:MAG: hypothetical protein LUE91_03120 [Oscillospiraceae bacterium]|nr:hypothetical protein [Oscillospiraceae bacterium]
MVKKFTNFQIVNTLNASADEAGKSLRAKRLPVKVAYAWRRSLDELERAYKVYDGVRVDLFGKYGADPAKGLTNGTDPQLTAEMTELLNMIVDVDVHTFPRAVLDSYIESCDDDGTLTMDELDRISWLVEEKE